MVDGFVGGSVAPQIKKDVWVCGCVRSRVCNFFFLLLLWIQLPLCEED